MFYKRLENYFSDEQEQKDAKAAAHFHIKAAQIAQLIIILRTFVLENLISVIRHTQHFYLSARSLVFGP